MHCNLCITNTTVLLSKLFDDFFKKMNKAYLDTFNLSDRHLQHLIFMMSIMKKKMNCSMRDSFSKRV